MSAEQLQLWTPQLNGDDYYWGPENTSDILAAALYKIQAAEDHMSALYVGLREIVELTGAQRGVLLIYPQNEDKAYPLITYRNDPTPTPTYIRSDALLNNWVLSWSKAETTGWFSLPLKTFGNVIGAIYVDKINYSGSSAQQKQVATEVLANQLALILALIKEDHKVLEITQERQMLLQTLSAVAEIDQQLNASLNVEHILIKFRETCSFLFNAEHCSIWLVDWKTETLNCLNGDGSDRLDDNLPEVGLNNSFVGQVARTGEATLIPDARLDQRYDRILDKTTDNEGRQLICVPLKVHGRVLGVVKIVNQPSDKYDELDLSLLELLTSHAAIALESAYRHTRQQKQAEEKVELYSVASHGLRSPLMTILTSVEWILESGVQDEMHQTILEDVRLQTFNLGRFASKILDLSRIETDSLCIQLMPTAVVPLIKETLANFEFRANNHQLNLQTAGNIPPVYADQVQLSIILDHLLDNAIKYSPEGSVVTVEVTVSNEQVLISVRDQGEGIPSDEIEQLFKPFYQRKHQAGRKYGVGLGLYIAKKLIEAQNGKIWAESQPNCGSQFIFALPQIVIGDN